MKSYTAYKPSGITWLGDVPVHWEIVRNGNIFYEVVDTNHPNLELLSLTITNGIVRQSSTGRKIRASEDRSIYKKIKIGDIGYNLMNAFFGGIGSSMYEGILSPAYAVCRMKFKIESMYFHYLFRTPLYMGVFNSFSYGIMFERNRLYFEKFKLIQSTLPPLSEQTKIVKFLNFKSFEISRFIKAKKRIIELLKEQKRAIINDAVTGKIDVCTGKPYPKYKPSGVEWLGDIPEEWEVRRLKIVAKIIVSSVDKNIYANELQVKLCNYTDVYKNNIIDNSLSFSKGSCNIEEFRKFQLYYHDVIITKDSETPKDIGVPALVIEELNNIVCGYHLAIIRTKKEHLLGPFLSLFLKNKGIARYFESESNGITRFGLGKSSIENTIIFIPNIETQKSIVSFIQEKTNSIDLAISRIEKELELILEYKNRLIADAVTGKIDVQDIEVPEVIEDIEEEILEEENEELEEMEGEE